MSEKKRVEAVLGLSPTQAGILYHCLEAPDSGVYLFQVSGRLEALDLEAFERAWQTAVDRHGVLRTAFVWEKTDRPVQVVGHRARMPIERHDWRELSPVLREERFAAHLENDSRRGFKLNRAPLMRLALMREGERAWRFLWTAHHIVLDGWSLALLLREVMLAYRAYAAGAEPELPPVRPYGDYLAWLEGRDLGAADEFWRRALAGFTAPTPLGIERRTGRAGQGEHRAVVETGEAARLRAEGRRRGITLASLLGAAWAVVLGQLGGEEDVVFGLATAGRPSELEGVERMIGLFINTLPVRVRLDRGRPLWRWLADYQERQAEQRDFEHTPLVRVRRASELPAGSPLFESVLAIEDFSLEVRPAEVRPAEVRPAEVRPAESAASLGSEGLTPRERTHYPLTVTASVGRGLVLRLAHDRSRIDDTAAERLLGRLRGLLGRLADGLECWPAGHELLSAAERHQLLVELNDSERRVREPGSLPPLFAATAESRADAIAVDDGDLYLSYAELGRRVASLSSRLVGELALGRGEVVPVLAPRGAELLVAILAIQRGGGAYLALDPRAPAARWRQVLGASRSRIVLVADGYREAAETALAELEVAGRPHLVLGWERPRAEPGPPAPPRAPSARELAYVVFTSGSTGVPKGVMVEHGGMLNHLRTKVWDLEIGADDTIAQTANQTFDISFWQFLAALLVGARVRIYGEDDVRSPLALFEQMVRHRVSIWQVVPTVLQAFLNAREILGEAGETPSLRWLLSIGEALPADLARRWRRQWPAVPLVNTYGPAECSDCVSHYHLEGAAAEDERIPIGRVLPNLRLHVVDRRLELVPQGVSGELCAGGVGVARGYLFDPRRTAEVFVPDPFGAEPGARLYHTGDLARTTASGLLDFLGRRDHQVKIRGVRIELGEIDAALREHPEVRQAVTLARGGTPGGQRLVAYLTASSPGLETAELRAFLARRLPEAMIPAAFVVLEEMPRNANLKIDRGALRRIEPAPPAATGGAAGELAETLEPGSAEETLAEIWGRVLGLSKIGLHDNFFELGGDSILGIQIASRARRAGLGVEPADLFSHPTVARLAAAVRPHEAPARERPAAGGEVPLTPIQAWFFELGLERPEHWNQSVFLKAKETPSAALLARAVGLLADRHDALRLRFRRSDGSWRQRYAESAGPGLFAHVDLSRLGSSSEARSRAAAATQASLDLERGPFARFVFFETGDGSPARLLIAIHHLVVDGVSWRILLEDLERLYRQLERGETPDLGEPTSSFGEWSAHLRELAASPRIAAELDDWAALAERPAAELPADRPHGGEVAAAPDTMSIELDAETTRELLEQAPTAFRTRIDDLLLTALALAWRRWTGASSSIVALEGHGREALSGELDLSRTVGWFTALYPVALELPSGSPGEQIKAVKESLRAIPNRGIGWGISRYLASAADGGSKLRRLRQMPTPELSFNYLGRFDRGLGDADLFELTGEPTGATRARGEARPHALEIDALVADGRLHARFTYGRERHRRETVEALAGHFRDALAELVVYCRTDSGFTPSDFPLAGLAPRQLDGLARQLDEAGLSPAEVEDVYPLAPAQEGILFHARLGEGSGTYLLQLACKLEGDFDPRSFVHAWRAVVARQPVLRTAFHWRDLDRPVQVVHRRAVLSVETEDWRGHDAVEGERREEDRALAEVLAAERRRGFDLSRPPLVRLRLIRLGEARWAFVCGLHHLLVDGWSVALVLREVLACYRALVSGRALDLGPVRPYRDHVAWLERRDHGAAEAFWRRALEGFDTPSVLPEDPARHGRPEAASAHGELRGRLSAAAGAALRGLAQTRRLTLATVVEGAWAIFLARTCGGRDVVFGNAVSGRGGELPGVDETVGLFINTLPVRLEVDPSAALGPWLEDFQRELAEMRRFEHTPLVEIQGWSELPRGTGLFEALFVFENYPLDRALGDAEPPSETPTPETPPSEAPTPEELPSGPRVERVWMEERNNYPLTLMVVPGSELQLQVLYDAERFSATTAGRWLGHLTTLLEALGAGASRTLGDLPHLAPGERHQLLAEWNDSRLELGEQATIDALFELRAEARSEAVALVCGEVWTSYGELARRAGALADVLAGFGVSPEVRVAVALERSPEMVVALLAVLGAGGAYVPLDPGYPPARLEQVFESAAPALLLTTESLREGLSVPAETRVLSLDRPLPAPGVPVERRRAAPENLAYAIYTSGSTGKPKGVQIAHRSGVNFLESMARVPGLAVGERFLASTTLAFDIAGLEIFLPLTVGATVDLAKDEVAGDGLRLLARLAESRPAAMQATPAGWRMLLEVGWEGDRALAVLCGGEALSPVLAEELAARGRELWNLYGPTETTIWSAIRRVRPGAGGAGAVPIGRPLANTRLDVVDGRGRPLGVGAVGELTIGGAGLCRGYLGRPAETALRLVPDPWSGVPGARLYTTGDRARRLADGEIDFLGRADHQVKVRGFRIELGEIETALERHPGVRAAVAVTRGERLAACVCPAGTARPTAGELRVLLAGLLPEYMVPSSYEFFESFPLTPNGKVDRNALAARSASAGVEIGAEIGAGREPTPPRNPFEETLAELFGEVLELERVGIHEDFFELGGHSLLATRVLARLRRAFGIEIGLDEFFAGPTVAGLAPRIETALGAGALVGSPPLEPGAEPRLSFAQERFFVLDQLEPGSAAYNVPVVVELDGRLDLAALEAALGEVTRRHEVLRASFPAVAGRAVLRVAPYTPLALPVIDLSALGESARRAEAERRVVAEARRGFDLGAGPLWRVALLSTERERHLCSLTLHHAVSDDWSMGVLVREVAALYRAALRREPSPLAPLPIQYSDWASWQRGWLEGAVLEEMLELARAELAGAPPLELPTDRPWPPVADPRGRTLAIALPAALTRALRELAGERGATLYMALASALQVLLARWSGQRDFCLGTPISGRSRAETEDLIGSFVNTLVLRSQLGGEAAFGEVLDRVRGAAIAAFGRHDLPFEKLVDALESERSRDRPPLFQVALVLQNAPRPRAELEGLRLSARHPETGRARYPLSFVFRESREGPLRGQIEFQSALFDTATLARLARQLEVLLEAALADPGARASALPILSAGERHQLLAEWRFGEGEQAGAPVHESIAAQAARTPAARALVCGRRELSYAELDRWANRLAHHLRALGVAPEVRVAVCAPRAPGWLVVALAVLKAGGVWVPLDPDDPPPRLRSLLEECGAEVLVQSEARVGEPPPTLAHTLELADLEALAAGRPETPPALEITPEHLAYVIFTSGSTGRPKGVMVDHRALASMVHWRQDAYRLGVGDAVLHAMALGCDPTVWDSLGPLVAGAAVVMPEPGEERDPERLAELVRRHGVTLLQRTPATLRALLDASEDDGLGRLRTVLSGGDPIPPPLRDRFYERCRGELYNLYGPTETVLDATAWFCREGSPRVPIPIGRPVAGNDTRVLDRALRPLPIGVAGELCLGGSGLARGYLGRPARTAVAFVPDPWSPRPGGRLYRTGDEARYDADGVLAFGGRLDDQVKVRGFRIELGEVETRLARHPAVREVAVVVRSEGGADKRLVAYVAARGGEGAPTSSELREFVRAALPEPMVPSVCVVLDELPRTAVGKIDRRALPAPAAERAGGEPPAPPRTAAERTLAAIWCRLLGLSEVGVHDNFFELGGDSISSLRIVHEARRAGLEIAPRQLFEQPTIAALAAAAGSAAAVEAEQGAVVGEVPLTPVQRWFFEQPTPHPEHWNQSVFFELVRPLDAALLRRVLALLVAHHDALRLRFERDDSGWRQRCAPPGGEPPFTVVDLASLAREDRRRWLEAAAADVQASLDLARGPLVRAVFFGLGAEAGDRLLIVAHHLVVDGVSWRILLEDLHTAYEQLAAGVEAALAPKTTSFKTWAERLVAHTASGALDEEIAHWSAERPGRWLSLPAEPLGGGNTFADAFGTTVALDEEKTRRLVQEAAASYRASVEEMVLAALARALGAWLGAGVLRIDLESHGREELFADVELVRTVGWFTAIYPLDLELDPGLAPAATLRRVKESLRAIPGRGVGFGLLRHLGDARTRATLDRRPAEVSFNYFGQFDRVLPGDAPLRLAAESAGPDQAPGAERPCLLSVNANVSGGRLRISFEHSRERCSAARLEELAAASLRELEVLLDEGEGEAGQVLIPTDFPEAEIDSDELANLLLEIEEAEMLE